VAIREPETRQVAPADLGCLNGVSSVILSRSPRGRWRVQSLRITAVVGHALVSRSTLAADAATLRDNPGVDGVHDLGGIHGFGPLTIDATEPVFQYQPRREPGRDGIAGRQTDSARPFAREAICFFHRKRSAPVNSPSFHRIASPHEKCVPQIDRWVNVGRDQ
jgi:hypothetical protein